MPSEPDLSKFNAGGAWITIGAFDGVHTGHRKIIRKLTGGAEKSNSASIVITFHPHPVIVLKKIQYPFYLSTPEEKIRVISDMGVTSILTVNFNEELANLTACEFMKILHNRLHFSCLMIGYDFHLGKNREGDIKKLREIGKQLGYCVQSIDPFEFGSQAVSSSQIRELLLAGKVKQAGQLLGREYEIDGEIIHGDGRGRHIGIPTANLAVWQKKLIPKKGIYASWARLDNQLIPSVVNIGFRPTFYESTNIQTIEVHLLDFNKDIYGMKMNLRFIDRIRDEKKYENADELMSQIHLDIIKSREVLEHAATKKNISP